MKRIVAATGLTAALAVGGVGLAGQASAVPAAPAFSCTINGYTHVQGADFLKVHTSPGTSTKAVGQLPDKAGFHFCQTPVKQADGRGWVYGYGYNGKTKLTGWVDGDYLAGP